MKSHNYSMFLNIYVAVIYVIIWHNEKCSTKKLNVSIISY